LNSIFSSNGKFNMTINGERLDITSNKPFSYGSSPVVDQNPLPQPQELAQVPKSPSKVESAPIPAADQTRPVQKSRVGLQFLRYTSLAIGIGSGAASAWYYLKRHQPAQLRLEDLSELDIYEKMNNNSKDWEAAAEDRNSTLGLCIAGSGGALIGVGFFTLSFAF
jgi:hypothetical protein